MKINSLEIENIKRIKAVHPESSANGLTIIGGQNGQGKTSVPDSIAKVPGGEISGPSKVKHTTKCNTANCRHNVILMLL